MTLERDPPAEPPRDLADVSLGDGELIVYDTETEAAWLQGCAVPVRR